MNITEKARVRRAEPAPWVARPKMANEALPNSYDMRAANYIPKDHNTHAYIRPGAMDFMDKPSIGYRT